MTTLYSSAQKRDAIVGIDPLLNAYFITLLENGQEMGNPLLFIFEGEDDSPSAQAQVKRVKHFKQLWVKQSQSFADLSRLHGSSANPILS